MTKALTSRSVSSVQPDPTKRLEIPDAGAPGLYLVVQPNGKKSWALRYRFDGRPIKLTLGSVNEDASVVGVGETPNVGGFLTLAEARSIGAEQRRLVAQGVNPAPIKFAAIAEAHEQKEQGTRNRFENVVKDFLKRHVAARELRSADQIEWVFKKHILPKWRGRDVASISKREVIDLIEDIADEGKGIMANRVLAHIRKLFAWAEGRDIITVNPAASVPKPAAEKSRDRVLTDAEIKAFWRACNVLGQPFGTLFQFMLLTGQRRDEVAQARRSEIVSGIWTVPALRAKNGIANAVPLSTQATALLQSVSSIGNKGLIFTTDGDHAVSGFSKAKAALDSKLRERDLELAHFVLHDLRRTMATGLARMG